MLLHTPLYLAFLALVAAAFWLLPSAAGRRWLLLAASYIFYLSFDLRFLLLLLFLTTANYWIARALPGSPRRRQLVWLSVAVNLGSLAVFKYAGFFLQNLTLLFEALGLPARPAALSLLVPIGISFYTFQALAYTTEVARGRLKPADHWLDVGLYLGFFPKLLAGPIVRPEKFLQQLSAPPQPPDPSELRDSLGLLLIGVFKKVVIADSLASIADVAFRAASRETAQAFPAPLYWQGFYLYAIQIFADFSGYTDIARASAGLLGFSLPENFDRPYLAATIGDFWNRWHMTLTEWLREYLFFPLSRMMLKATQRRYSRLVRSAATLCTMMLIGLWHGASWTFVGWGAWHGVLLVLDRLTGWRPKGPLWVALSTVATFHLVGLGWILFRAQDAGVAGRFLASAVSLRGVAWSMEYLPVVILVIGLTAATGWIQFHGNDQSLGRARGWAPSLVVMALVVLTALAFLQQLRGEAVLPFIYAQF